MKSQSPKSTLPFAEDVNFWQTSKTSTDTWVDRAKRQIQEVGGKVLGDGFGSDADGRAAFMLAFECAGEKFKIVWPVLPTRSGNQSAARIQAATLLYHDVKNCCLRSEVFGVRAAFFSYLMLPDGRTAAQVASAELAEQVPHIFLLA